MSRPSLHDIFIFNRRLTPERAADIGLHMSMTLLSTENKAIFRCTVPSTAGNPHAIALVAKLV